MGENYLISDAAKKVKVEAHVLRYWEEELGLPIKRNELGHRYYTEDDVRRFQEIRELKEQGLQLKAIRMVLKNGKLDMLSPRREENGEPEPVLIHARNQAGQDNRINSGKDFAEGKSEIKSEEKSEEESERKAEKPSEEQEEREMPVVQKEALAEVYPESREEKAARLQWLLQHLIRETLQENNEELCREIKESILKELDYQFRQQEEKAEEREAEKIKREEEHYKKVDDLLRKKRRLLKK